MNILTVSELILKIDVESVWRRSFKSKRYIWNATTFFAIHVYASGVNPILVEQRLELVPRVDGIRAL